RISRLRLPLAPLLPMPSGPPHPDFPLTLLAYHLLTEDQLDRLAHYYHQSTPGVYTNEYPAPVLWPRRRSSASLLDDDERIAIKRRKIGKFIGLVGMQTP
ncbi:hypothetical protein BDZ85DRAFT_184146, partial [Elsinoe ampelina]